MTKYEKSEALVIIRRAIKLAEADPERGVDSVDANLQFIWLNLDQRGGVFVAFDVYPERVAAFFPVCDGIPRFLRELTLGNLPLDLDTRVRAILVRAARERELEEWREAHRDWGKAHRN